MSILTDLSTTEYRRFDRPRTVYEYGFDASGLIAQDGSPSKYLLPWEAIDAHTDSIATGKPCLYIVTGEHVREDGVRFPELSINPAWMEARGYRRENGRWVRESHV